MIELVDHSNPETYNLTHPRGATFSLLHWTKGMQEEIDRRCVKIVGKKVEYDVALDREIKIDKCLVGWSGVAEAGQEVPCTPENKKKLPVGVLMWLIKQIEDDAGFNLPDEEKKN